MQLLHSDLLPNLHIGPTLVVTSDYGGQHKSSTHESFSFLIADLKFCWLWDEARDRVRITHSLDKRRMSYKALNDRRRQSALLPFLAAANGIPGVLATVIVDKSFMRSLQIDDAERSEFPKEISLWPAHVLTKMVFVLHLGALFISGLSRVGQNVVWMTDNDDFVANDRRVIELTPLFAAMVSQYSQRRMGHFRFGTMKCDIGDLFIEDLASLPDLACGALCEIPVAGVLPKRSAIRVPVEGHLSSKAHAILGWLTEKGNALRRLTIVVDHGDSPGKIRARALEFSFR
jgi:hypothetical protein